MKNILLTLMLAAIVAGCTTPTGEQGYQLGDGSKRIAALYDRYCNQGDPLAKALLVTAVRTVDPAYPIGGICQSLPKLLIDLQSVE